MKRFRFGLRPVAVVRAHRELRARERFASAVHTYVTAEEELAGVRERIARLATELFESRRGSFEAGEHAHCLAGFREQSAAEIPAERAVFAARAEMERLRAEYLAANRDLKLVGRVEEKSRARYRLACDREEQAGFDDLAGARSARSATA